MLDPGQDMTLPKQMLEINTAHPIIKGLHAKHTTDPELAVSAQGTPLQCDLQRRV